jgi:HK97 family phage major capsid protein
MAEGNEILVTPEGDIFINGVKSGARNSASDMERLQQIHDYSVENGAKCNPEDKTVPVEGSVKAINNCLKAISSTPDELRVANYIVLFGGRDLSGEFWKNQDGSKGEYFTPQTTLESNYTKTGFLHVDFEHSRDPDGMGIGEDDVLGYVDWKTAKIDDAGVFVERVLNRRQKYVQWLEPLIEEGLIGNSSEAIPSEVVRAKNGEIKKWPLRRDTLTVNPMEPRMISENAFTAIKSLADNVPYFKAFLKDESDKPAVTESEPEAEQTAASDGVDAEKSIKSKESKMEITPEIQELLDQTAVKAAQVGVEEFKKSFPAEDLAKLVVTHDPADNEFKSLAEQCLAVKNEKVSKGRIVDPRLLRIAAKTTGAGENVPSDGGYTLDPTINTELIKMIHEDGPFTSKVRRLPVSTNSNSGWINGVDETSRVAGSRWGGVRGYRLAEGETPTASKPKFRRINWELKKYGVLMYATDELLADSAQFNAVAKQSAMEELVFMANDDIVNGTGLGGPLGIMTANCRVSVAREDASKVQHVDIVNMWKRLYPTFRGNAAWFINSEVESHLDQLYFTGTTSVLSPYVSYTTEGVMRIMGKPVFVTEFNPGLNAAGDIILADMSQYLYWDKPAEAAISVDYVFPADETVFRFIYRVDGQPAFSSALTPYKSTSTNTQSPFVSLGAASA